MHSIGLGAVLGFLLSVLVLITPQPAAYAEHCGPGQASQEVEGGFGHICVSVTIPATPGGGDTGDNTGDEGPATCQDEDGDVVPCSSESGGTWNSAHNCYAYPMDPQPPAGPIWDGNDPSEGSMWECGVTIGVPPRPPFFIPSGAVPLVDPAALAQHAVDQLDLELADAKIAPSPAFHTYVHIDNWLWVPEEQWRDLQLTVSAGPTSVTVAAAPVRVDWSMGTDTKSCYDAGRVWQKGMSDAAQTTCSYAYETIENPTGDSHVVSAQIVYGVTWTCSGACVSPSGDLGEITAPSGETTTIEVRQRQTVVTQ